MKIRVLSIVLSLMLLLTACGSGNMENQVESMGDAVENKIDKAENAVEQAMTPTSTSASRITKEEAAAIALQHAGFTEDQVTFLRTEYEMDDGIPLYEVDFHHDRWEYTYEIHAETGEILSYDRDD